MKILILMSSSEPQRNAVASGVGSLSGWAHFPVALPDLADPAREAAWRDACEALRVRRRNVVVSTPFLSARELQAIRDLRPLSAWLKQPFEAHDPPTAGTVLLDGTMAAEAIAWTINAVFRLPED